MSVDLSDPDIIAAYNAVSSDKEALNWLLLRYVESKTDVLSLAACGLGGFAELKLKIETFDDVFYCLYRDEWSGQPRYIFISYIPEWISSVRRARLQVHSRRVSALFATQDAKITVSRLDNLTLTLIRHTLLTPPAEPGLVVHHSDRAFSHYESDYDQEIDSPVYPTVLATPVTPTVEPIMVESPPPTKSGFKSLFSVRRRKQSVDPTPDDDVPPPPPPKDRDGFRFGSLPLRASHAVHELPLQQVQAPPMKRDSQTLSNPPTQSYSQGDDNGEFGVLRRPSDEEDFVVVDGMNGATQTGSNHFRSKWSTDVTGLMDTAERTRRRKELQMQRELEDEEVIRAEKERQERIKREKEELRRQEEEDEARRKFLLEQEIRQAAAMRAEKERQEREVEERDRRILEERKRMDRERRLEEGRRTEQRLKEWQKEMEEEEKKAATEREQAAAAKAQRIRMAEARLKRRNGGTITMTGWATVQNPESLSWRRRYFEFEGSRCLFFRSSQDKSQVLESLDVGNQLKGLKDWNDGYEELKAIPNSFAVELMDGTSWFLFTDTADQKYELLGSLSQAAHP